MINDSNLFPSCLSLSLQPAINKFSNDDKQHKVTSNVTNKTKDAPVDKPKKVATPPQTDSQPQHQHRASNEQPTVREVERIGAEQKPVDKPVDKHADKPQFDKPVVIDHSKPNDNTTIPHHHPVKPDERRTSSNGKSTLFFRPFLFFLALFHSFAPLTLSLWNVLE